MKLRRHLDNLLVERVINILYTMQCIVRAVLILNLFVRKLGKQFMIDSLDSERTNQEDSQKMFEFVYKVNFEAGKGQNYLHIFACIGL